MKILVSVPRETEVFRTFFTEEVREQIESAGEVIWNEGHQRFTTDELKKLLPGVDVMLTGWGSPSLTDELLPHCDKLRLVAHTGGTVAGLVCDAAYEKGIKVSSGNDMYAESVAEGCVAYFMTALRDIPLYDQRCHSGAWAMDSDFNEGLLDQTVGLIGLGSISRHLINFLKPFRCKIKVVSQHTSASELEAMGVERAELVDVFTTCKIVSVHLARTPATYHRVNRELLESMPDGTIFVNTARGACVDEVALSDVLSRNPKIKAVLDVFDEEPLPKYHPFRKLGNVILQPHFAGPTRDRRPYVTKRLFADALSFLNNGTPMQYEIGMELAKYMTR